MSRIMFWSNGFRPGIGGVEILATRLLPALRMRGHEFLVVTHQEPFVQPEYEEYEGIPMHRLPYWQVLASRDLSQVRRMGERVLRLVREFQPDLVHVFSGEYETYFVLKALSVRHMPLLVTLHNLPSPRSLGADAVLGTLLRRADRLTTCSRAVLEHIERYVPGIALRTSVIRNALARVNVPPTPLPLAPPRLLYLGRLHADKGVDLALRAFAQLYERFQGVSLIVAGDGPERAALEQLASSLGIARVVTFAGWVDPADVPRLLNETTIVVMPSRSEGLGLVAVQAAQQGRPVVGMRVGGIPEVVRDGQTGILVRPEDVAGLAGALAQLLECPQRAIAIGKAAYDLARTHDTWDEYLAAYDQLYRRLCPSDTQ